MLVIGAGVAGLAAIGAARSLGAVVRAFDTRPVVRQQIESLGAEFLTVEIEEDGSGSGGYAKEMSPAFIEAEMKLFAEQAREVDIIITTALIPGKPAPRLLEAETVALMRPGSVVVDMAAEQGGNCVLTVPGEVVNQHGVTVIGYTDLPSRMAAQSSQLYATNIRHLLTELTPGKDGELVVNMDDEMIRGATVLHQGDVTWPPPPLKTAPPPAPAAEVPAQAEAAEPPSRTGTTLIALAIGAVALLGMGAVAPPASWRISRCSCWPFSLATRWCGT